MDLFNKIVQTILPDKLNEPQLIGLTYLWRIENYSKIPSKKPNLSADFMIDKDLYCLELTKDEDFTLLLRQLKRNEPTTKFSCSTSLVDQHGKLRYLQRTEIEMNKSADTKQLLAIPSRFIEDERCIIPLDILSVQFSINRHTEYNQLSPPDTEQSLTSLSCDLGRLFEDKTDSDIVLKAGRTEFRAHRLVLSARSPTFSQMLRQNSKQPPKGNIDIKDVDASVLGNVLGYIYTGKVQGLTSDTAAKLIEAADKFQLEELKATCIIFLTANLTLENICDAVLVAKTFRDEVLEMSALDFIRKNASDVVNSDQWSDFKSNHSQIANTVLASILLSVQSQA